MAATNAPSTAEQAIDDAKLRKIAAQVAKAFDGAEMQMDKATCWGDRWRVPLYFHAKIIRLDGSHFDKVSRMGAQLVVEESFDGDEMNCYTVEIPRTRLRGIYAWSRTERYICFVVVVILITSLFYLYQHVQKFVVA